MRFFPFIFCLIFASNSLANPYTLITVYDGDTVKLRDANGTFKLRLTGIDAPERNQSYGKKSRRAVIKLCKNKHVTVSAIITGMDKYQRYLGRLFCNQIDVSLYLTQQGLAWHNSQYSNDMTIFIAQAEAKQQRIGLWQQQKPMPPWVWRRLQKQSRSN